MATANVLALGVFKEPLQTFVFGYDKDENAASQNRESGEALAKQIEEEGIVMVKNEDDVLPLVKALTPAVNVFGWSSVAWVPGGSGSGRVVNPAKDNDLYAGTDLIEALNDYGIETNVDLTNFYKANGGTTRPGYSAGTLNTYDYQFHRLIEPKMNQYSEDLLADAEEFSDTAIVVLSRVSGESSDAPKVQYKGGNSKVPDDSFKTYLDASDEEIELLEYVASAFDQVVVVINSTNTMNLSFLDEIDGLDSCLVVGGTGVNAATGVVSVLYGDVTPSGHLVDTYPYDFKTNPTYAFSGSDGVGTYTGSNGYYPADGTTNPNVGSPAPKYDGVSYLDYAEGIYVGYKWYETADAEGYWDDVHNEYGDGYDGVVQFPFGYGQSYTTFSWEIVALSPANASKLTKDGTIEVTVRVTNTGDYDGKDVVQLYYTAPYKDGGIEKAHVNLAAFEKTTLLEPGLFEDVKLSFKVEDMASYDFNDINFNGIEGYELEKGNYQVKLMTDSHHLKELTSTSSTAHNNAIINYEVNENNVGYDTDSVTGNDVYNRFVGDYTEDGVSIDGDTTEGGIQYLSRSDFAGTFLDVRPANRAYDNKLKQLNLYNASMANADNDPSDTAPTFGANNGLKVIDNGELTELGNKLAQDFEADEWEDLLDQLTESELRNLALHGYVKTGALASVGKPEHAAADGPNQIGSFNFPKNRVGTGFPNSTVLAQTWSKSLAYSFGLAIGAETRTNNFEAWYGPGINLHRSPFGGRNYEYYSEDPYLSGAIGLNAVKGAKNSGVYCFLKHLICYEQESMRDSIHTWLTEQALREIYLKPFKMCIQEGGAGGVMTSYNRIGATWAGGQKALITGVLREEWGFNGVVLTDYADHQKFMNGDQSLRAGGDLWMDGFSNNGSFKFDTASNTFKQHLRRAGKDMIYVWLNTIYTNVNHDPSEDAISVVIGKKGKPKTWWIPTLIGVDVAVVAGLAVWSVLILLPKKKKEE